MICVTGVRDDPQTAGSSHASHIFFLQRLKNIIVSGSSGLSLYEILLLFLSNDDNGNSPKVPLFVINLLGNVLMGQKLYLEMTLLLSRNGKASAQPLAPRAGLSSVPPGDFRGGERGWCPGWEPRRGYFCSSFLPPAWPPTWIRGQTLHRTPAPTRRTSVTRGCRGRI